VKRFALIGVAGYIAPRHLQAIRDTGNHLVAAMDKFDSVGILDHYFPKADFFIEVERFDRFLDKCRREENAIDYLSVCTPNYLHDAHVRFGLRHGASVICEKPLALNPWNVEALARVQQETGKDVFNILQLRLHPGIIALKEKIQQGGDEVYDVDLTYITPRGNWYHTSWKGDISKSGGIATNIGIHFFDMLVWIFGSVKQNTVHIHTPQSAAGYLELEKARVRWFLSIDETHLPADVKEKGGQSLRLMTMGEWKIDFSEGFDGLHTKSYEAILSGHGYKLPEALPSIELTHRIRTQEPVGLKGDYHPMLSTKKNISLHNE
jgi:UDP-N-acetyl-2-amino-2-deoxyglucuronate dehydrogenase